MKIAIISTGYFWTPVEAGTSRLFDIAMTFARNGWETEVITTSFEHFEKRPRDRRKILAQKYPFQVTFIPSPSYRKNIDVRRAYSNGKTAVNLKGYLEHHGKDFDVVYCTIPSNRIAAETVRFCQKNRIPVVIDIEDLWPEAMRMVIPSKVLCRLLLGKVKKDADYVYRHADGIIGTSEDYTARAFQNRPKDIPYCTVFVGCDLDSFDEGVRKYGPEIEKKDGERWITYAGSLGESYGLFTLLEAAAILQKDTDTNHIEHLNCAEHIDCAKKKTNIRIKILGTGPMEKKLKAYAGRLGCRNVDFLGFRPYPEMAAYLAKSDIVVNSFRKNAPQSFVNKVGDYLASGRPMINMLENPLFQKLVKEEKIGLNIEAENPKALASSIEYLLKNPKLCQEMSFRERRLAEDKFDRKKTYQEIVDFTDRVAEAK